MPKKRSTASKRARAAARGGEKFTTVLRAARAHSAEPASAGWDELVVAALSAVVAEHGTVPVTVLWDRTVRTSMVQREDGVRWGVAEPAADGVVIREVRADVGVVPKGTRIPVPYRLDDGRVEVAAPWPPVWSSTRDSWWRYVHNGWAVERPGDHPTGLDPIRPSLDLPYEVRTYYVPDGVVGEDHTGSAPCWWSEAWCDRLDKAVLLADALVAHRSSSPGRPAGGDCGYLRAEVWEHAVDLRALPSRVHRDDAGPDPARRAPPAARCPVRRPSRLRRARPEPTRLPGETHPPTYNLRVWSETAGWETLAWVTSGRGTASAAASLLRVGTGGPYAWAETWGPRHPDSWRHDWTQEGQQLMDRHPRESYAEDTVRYAEKRRREEAALAAGPAARSAGTLTVETAAARLASGGREYRDFLRVGQICVMDALDEHRLSFPEGGNERVLARQALDLLEERHEVEDWVVTLTRAHMATTRRDAPYSEGARWWRERALKEHLSPREDVIGVPGLSG